MPSSRRTGPAGAPTGHLLDAVAADASENRLLERRRRRAMNFARAIFHACRLGIDYASRLRHQMALARRSRVTPENDMTLISWSFVRE